MDLHLDLDSGVGVRAGLEEALRRAVRDGRLAPGTRLPSSRVLARDMGVARNTVAEAYGQLVAEGWLTACQGSGTWVTRGTFTESAPAPTAPVVSPSAGLTVSGAGESYPYNLRPGSPDLSSFPHEAWLAASRRALAAAPRNALGYADPRGQPELREALAEYLGRVRAVRTEPGLIVVCSGFTQATGLLGRALCGIGGRRIAVEALGFPDTQTILRNAGLETVRLPLDADGARVDRLAGEDALLCTPSHQFPTGVAMPPARRMSAVAWARERGAVIMEDDYDGEFRYDRQPVGALQGLAPNHVVYAGTTSKSLAPGLRLGWLVLPPHLLEPVAREKWLADRHAPVIDQLTLAQLIVSGAYDRHVRRMRGHYRRRRDRLVTAVTRHAPRVRVTGLAAGMHAVLELPADGPGEAELVTRAERQGLALAGISLYGSGAGPALVVGYGTPPEHAFAGALERLCAVLGS
ncbi:PLP-dependent aminotransferase family protein [Actinoallomurus iriomotensis]|uniref:MocR-like pyridoxine biosynthesis transcription factor PdxR n=1 Tax=Actinoallomurus iriomotensis TaxID=478107 RepID=UPI002553643A|nr:PLP-dependent aminotransferase family protein [Actinoallomurus iriomotensis]